MITIISTIHRVKSGPAQDIFTFRKSIKFPTVKKVSLNLEHLNNSGKLSLRYSLAWLVLALALAGDKKWFPY